MPINLFNNPLSSIRLGANNILKGYIGNSQIFPNDTEIAAAAFTNSNIANTGGNTSYVVTGDIGSSFTLTGSNGATAPSGTQVISSSPATYQIAIADQSTICGATARNSQIVIIPQGNTVLASAPTYNITVSNASGSNKYYVDGTLQPNLPLAEGTTYIINQDDVSNASHPLILSTSATSSGVYNTGVTYTLDGSTVTYSGYISGFASASQRRLAVNLSSSVPSLNYICYYHQNMGSSIITSDSNNTDTIVQAAGPVNQTNNNSLSISAVNTVYNTVTVGGQLQWSTGARWTVTISYTAGIQNAVQNIRARFTNPATPNQFPVYSPQNPISPGLGTWLYGGGGNPSNVKTGFVFANSGTDIVNPPSGTYSFDVVIGSNVGSHPYVNFYTDLTAAAGCYTTAVPSASTGLLYP